jgi:predicted anti-sigma-YlaC factor YlaD
MTTPRDFIKLASVIEGVGVSAYLGAAPLVTSKAYLTAAGAILVTEALHNSLQRGAIGEVPAANVFGSPLGLNAVYRQASHCFSPLYRILV